MPYPTVTAGAVAPGSNGSFGTLAASGGLTLSGSVTDITSGANEHITLIPNGTGNIGAGVTVPISYFDIFKTGTGSTSRGLTVRDNVTPTFGGNADNLLTVRGTGTSVGLWRGRITAGGDNVALLFGEANAQAWFGAHNSALNAWADVYISPDGGTQKTFIGVVGSQATGIAMTVQNSNGNVGLRQQVPTAMLHIGAGAAAAGRAPLKIDSGTLLTTAEAGAVEFLTNDMYYTGTDGTRRRLAVNSQVIRLRGFTVATLPAGTQGDKAFVTDALAPTYLVTVAGGGSVVTEVFYNGASWVCT